MTPLGEELSALIAAEGPISVERYMALCLSHPRHGYYMTRDPLGVQGDFTTAPEISQMFGELIGLWLADVWLRAGSPPAVHLVECGPGRGTLMADILRATRKLPGFHDAITLHLIETSPVLAAIQKATLAKSGVAFTHHDTLETVPRDQPLLLVANEFLDALPIRQYQFRSGHWHERVVGIGSQGALAFGLTVTPENSLAQPAEEGVLLEVPLAGLAFMQHLAMRLTQQGGAALLIDYGHTHGTFGDTLQAVQAHAPIHPLAAPGTSDLTAHVNFAMMRRAAETEGARCHGAIEQRAFLARLGLAERAEVLMRGTTDQALQRQVAAARERLMDPSETGMGQLFKVLAVTHPAWQVSAFEV